MRRLLAVAAGIAVVALAIALALGPAPASVATAPPSSPLAIAESPSLALSSPEIASPSVEPTAQPSVAPSATPPPPIDKVPVPYPGWAHMENEQYSPGYFLNIDNAVVVYVDPAPTNGTLWFAVTLQGKRIGVTCGERRRAEVVLWKKGENSLRRVVLVRLCQFTGATLWFRVDKRTSVRDYHGQQSGPVPLIGVGPSVVRDNLRVGEVVGGISVLFGDHPRFHQSATEIALNRDSLARLIGSAGERFPRADRRFSFYTGGISP